MTLNLSKGTYAFLTTFEFNKKIKLIFTEDTDSNILGYHQMF